MHPVAHLHHRRHDLGDRGELQEARELLRSKLTATGSHTTEHPAAADTPPDAANAGVGQRLRRHGRLRLRLAFKATRHVTDAALTRVADRLRRIRWMNTPPRRDEAYIPTDIEHVANVLTHLLAIVPSYQGTLYLFRESESRWQQLCALVYGCALIALFCVSTLFHSIFFFGRLVNLRRRLHRLDRTTIYFFIASSYTPWLTLRNFQTVWDRYQIVLIWLACIGGVLYQRRYHERYKTFSVIMYCIIAIYPTSTVINMHPLTGIGELALGGLVYLVGVVFFKLDGRLPLAHAIWHLCVDVAALIHFNAIATHLYDVSPTLSLAAAGSVPAAPSGAAQTSAGDVSDTVFAVSSSGGNSGEPQPFHSMFFFHRWRLGPYPQSDLAPQRSFGSVVASCCQIGCALGVFGSGAAVVAAAAITPNCIGVAGSGANSGCDGGCIGKDVGTDSKCVDDLIHVNATAAAIAALPRSNAAGSVTLC